MMVALRYVEQKGGYWEVRTEESIQQHTSLRQFPEQQALAALATRALHAPGVWIHVATEKEKEQDTDG